MSTTDAYKACQREMLTESSPRTVEGWALIELARRLDVHLKSGAQADPEAIREIVRLNWRVWTIFQASLVESESPLPAEIRSNLLNLAYFIDRHSLQILRAPKASELEVLIAINRHIGNGLLGNPAEPEDEDKPSAQNIQNNAEPPLKPAPQTSS